MVQLEVSGVDQATVHTILGADRDQEGTALLNRKAVVDDKDVRDGEE
jgi:hypothetical protein